MNPRPVQDRTTKTRQKIFEGAIEVLARGGVAGVTHRAVADTGGVSLAATTYHFDSKSEILTHVSRTLLSGYLETFRHLQARVVAGTESGLGALDDLVLRVVLNAIGRERTRSLAWCELILHGGREAEGRILAQDWYAELDKIWLSIGRHLDPSATQREASAAVDLSIGLTLLFHPLDLGRETAVQLFRGALVPKDLAVPGLAGEGAPAASGPAVARYREARARIVAAAIDVLVERGRMAVSYRSVAERAGLVRSGPAYYFPSIGTLLEAAQHALLARTTGRYLATLESLPPDCLDEAGLADLSTTLYFREILEHGQENIGFYAICATAAQTPALRPALMAALVDQHRAWSRLLAVVGQGGPHRAAPLRLQALLAGKTIRAVATGADTALLARARDDFAIAIRAAGPGRGGI